MRRVLALATTMALLTCHMTMADEKDDVKIDVKSGGATIIVDGDGNVQVKKFGDFDDSKILKDLPEEIREKVKKAMKEQDGKTGAAIPFGIRGIFIGPDGKKHEFGKGDGEFGRKKMLEGLPEEIRKKIEEAMKDRGEFPGIGGRFGGKGAGKVEFRGKAVIIGPDGKKQEFEFGKPGDFDPKKHFEGLPKEIREKMEKAMKEHGGAAQTWGGFGGGKAIIIGPDGKPKEIDLGDGNFDPADLFKEMPKEVQDAIKKSMKNGNFVLPFGHPKAGHRDDASSKQILDKLEDLQKQIDELRKQLEKK